MSRIKNFAEGQIAKVLAKNPKAAEKLLKSKYIRDGKAGERLLSLFLAGSIGLGGAGIATALNNRAAAEENAPQTRVEEQTQENPEATVPGFEFVLQPQEAVSTVKMTYDDYVNKVVEAYLYVVQFTSYDHLAADLQSAVFLANKEYIDAELEAQLIKEGFIFEQPHIPADFENWTNFVNQVNDFNEQRIHEDWKAGKKNADNLINPSILCFDEHDKKDVDTFFRLYVDAYDLTPNTIMSGKAMEFHKAATQLNSPDSKRQLYNGSVGARLASLSMTSNEFIRFLHDYIDANYAADQKELILEYYDEHDSSQNHYTLKPGIVYSNEDTGEFLFIVRLDGEETRFAQTEVFKDMKSRLITDMQNAAEGKTEDQQVEPEGPTK
jgi:hypothetical protein